MVSQSTIGNRQLAMAPVLQSAIGNRQSAIIPVGIIGFGRIGAEHAAWLQAADGIRAAAVADITPARRQLAEARGLVAYESIGALLADKKIDAVLVANPTAFHFDAAMAALSAGKHVMVEKPITLDLPQAIKLVECAEQRGLTLSVFHNRRWDRDYLTVQAAVRSGIFGKIINIESRLGQWSSCVGPAAREYRPGWRNEAAFGGGGLYDWGSHFVDQLWRLMLPAKPVEVFAQLRGNVWTRDCDDFARVCLNFDNGAVAMVEINTTTTRPLPRWHIDGTAGSADSPFDLGFNVDHWADVDFVPAGQSTAIRLPKAAAGLSETQIWNRFARAIAFKQEPAVPVRSVLPTMAILDAARNGENRMLTDPEIWV